MSRSFEGRVRGLGTAHEGLHHWTVQRLTAVANVPLIAISLLLLCKASKGGYEGAVASIGQPLVAAWFGLTLIVAFYHAALGLQVVIEDYVSGKGAKFALLFLVRFLAALCAVAGLASLISLL